MVYLKVLISFFVSIVLLSCGSCGVNKQARELKALEDCEYNIVSADRLYVAGTAVKEILGNGEINMSKLPGVALGFLTRDIPFEGTINLQIDNPTSKQASINQFQYLIMIKDQEIANGFVDQKIDVVPGGSTKVPIVLKANIYKILSDSKSRDEIMEFLSGGNTDETEKKSLITFKIKPSISIGNKLVNYPGYITINKELSSKILF